MSHPSLKKKPTIRRTLVRERGNSLLRFLDRYLGIPLVLGLSIFKKKRPFPSIDTIALLKTAGIGDTTLLSSIIYDLQRAYPEKKITLFTGQSNYEMGKLIEGIEVVPLPIASPLKALQKIRKSSFSLWMDCDPWPRINALFTFFSRSCYTLGYHTKHQYRHFLYDRTIPHSSTIHEVENYRNLLRSLSLPTTHHPRIVLPSTSSKKREVALHLFPGGSRADLKMWSEKNWRMVIDFLLNKNYSVVLTGGEKERVSLEALAYDGRIANMAGRLSLRETAHLLLSCSCLISVDTGIMHLAASLSCPVIALHGPTSPDRWGGIGEKVVSLTPPYGHTPCISLGFEKKCKQCGCMEAISVEKVKEAFLKIEETI